ncbi:MAG: transglutaminase family protein [Chitinophagaceae bacterium]|nr:MAG: transglutaminase family protein [Chitinophagaceae bacterium]
MFNRSETYTAAQRSLLYIAAILVIIPLAPYINRFIPLIQIGDRNFDLVISLALAFLIARLILWIFKPLIIPALAVVVIVLLWSSFKKEYTFSDVYSDYKNMVWRNWITRDEKQPDVLNIHPEIVETGMAKTVKGIRSKMDYKDSVVRNFAVQHSLDYFQDYYTKYGQDVRYLSLFKYIREHFNYVPDPKRDEYFATPQETILNGLGGDCDDHAILMASCLRSIGGITRIVIIKGHAYPELYCGDKKDFEEMKSAIVQLFDDPPVKQIYFHEYDGQYWINMDYTAVHPGGPYLNNDVLAVVDW